MIWRINILRTSGRLIISLTEVQITACGVCVWYLGLNHFGVKRAIYGMVTSRELLNCKLSGCHSHWKRFSIFIETIKPTHTRDTWPNNHQQTKYFPNKGERAIKNTEGVATGGTFNVLTIWLFNVTIISDQLYSVSTNNFFKCIKSYREIET